MSDATVTNIETRRHAAENVLRSVSFVFGGVHYGTVPLGVPYTQGEPLVLYVVPEHDTDGVCERGTEWVADHLDCKRSTEGVAVCRGRSTGDRWTVTLRRQGPPPAAQPKAAPADKPKSLESLFDRK